MSGLGGGNPGITLTSIKRFIKAYNSDGYWKYIDDLEIKKESGMLHNFLKRVKALKAGTILYNRTTDQLLISCGCKPMLYRLIFGLNLKTEIYHQFKSDMIPNQRVKIEITGVKNLANFTIIGSMK